MDKGYRRPRHEVQQKWADHRDTRSLATNRNERPTSNKFSFAVTGENP
jgi:hypothetical protein